MTRILVVVALMFFYIAVWALCVMAKEADERIRRFKI